MRKLLTLQKEVIMSWNKDDNHNSADKQINWEEKWLSFKNQIRQFITDKVDQLPFKKLLNYSMLSLFALWIASSVYIVDQGNRGVVTRFGAYSETTKPGPHWHMPFPIEQVTIVNVEKQRFIEVGYRSVGRRSSNASVLPEALMLTKDENIVSILLAVQYQINSAKDYLFNVKSSEATLKQVTESVQRGVVGRNSMDFILTEGRSEIVAEIKEKIQLAMDNYGTGLQITSVNLQDAQPPEEVQGAFEDAIRAREDKQRLINEAQAYANEVIPKARGKAARMIQEAKAYETQVVEESTGDAQRFDQLLVEYEKAPKITRKRLYLEAKENLYKGSNKVLVNVDNGSNMFYLPLNQLPQTNQNQNVISNEKSNSSLKEYKTNQGTNVTRTNIRSSRSKK